MKSVVKESAAGLVYVIAAMKQMFCNPIFSALMAHEAADAWGRINGQAWGDGLKT